VQEIIILNSLALNNGFTNERGFDNTYRILKNIVGLWLIQGLQNSFSHTYNFKEIEAFARDSETCGIIFPDDTLFYNPRNMREAIDEYLRKTGQDLPVTPGQYFRIAYDSLCCSFRDNLEKLERVTGRKIEVVHMIGGGCRSSYLCQQTANISRRQVIAGPVEGSAMGNIMVQALALNVLNSVEEGKKMVRNSFDIVEYIPEEYVRKTERIYKTYKKLIYN